MLPAVPDMVIDTLGSAPVPRKLPVEDGNHTMIVNNCKRDEKLDN